MKLLLTSGGITNNSIRDALIDLLGGPTAEADALCIPTAAHAISKGPAWVWRAINDWLNVEWKSFGLLELSALPTVRQENWRPQYDAADALLVGGGNVMYLWDWLQRSGIAELLPLLQDKVYVGISAGSMVVCPRIGKEFVSWPTPGGDDRTLGLVDFAIFPHLNHKAFPNNTLATGEKWAAGLSIPAYAIDDQTAIKVVDGVVEVISEGEWKLFGG